MSTDPMDANHLPPKAALTVVVADDIERSRLGLAQGVRALGHRCLLCGSGREVLELAPQADVVLLDLLMPDLDGFEVTRQLRLRVTDRWLPVIVTSSLKGEEHFIQALSQGADDYLTRPVTPALLEAKLRHYQWVLGELRRMERMKDEFLATVSHELRTPLTSVIGALGLVASGVAGTLPPAALGLAQVAQRNGERLSRLIDDVLDLTKLEGNRMVLQLRAVALDKLVAEAVAANQSYAQRGQVVLGFECLGSAPKALVDADRFLQVMANLLSNAIKHSRAGQEVRVTLLGVPEGWRIDVTDRGPGIDQAFRARLFDKFAQADSSDRRAVGGTGLGLYVSRMLVERMKGRIVATSELGVGSTFSVVLPAFDAGKRWLLCLARDRQRLERLVDWLSPLIRVETATDVTRAEDLLAREGPPAVVVADPQDQGPSDAFCACLRRWIRPDAIVLTGDSIDADFATQQGLVWISLVPKEGRQAMVEFVRERLSPQALKD